MSVINQVLQDLAQRNAGLDSLDEGLGAVRAVPRPPVRRRRVMPMVATGVMGLATVLWWVGRPAGGSGQDGEVVRPMAFLASAEAAALVRPSVTATPVIAPDDAADAMASRESAGEPDRPAAEEAQAGTHQDLLSLAYERAMEARDAGHREDAQQALMALLEQQPGHLLARQALMGLMLETDRNLEAEALATEGLQHFPSHLPFAMTSARLQAESGDLRLALETLERFGAAGDGHRDFLAFHASLLQKSGLHAEAVERYGQALALGDAEPAWLVEQAVSLRRLGQTAEARAQLRQVASMKRLPAALRNVLKRELEQL